MVRGRALIPHASAAATESKCALRPVSSQRIVAQTAMSHMAALVVSDK